MPRVERIPFHKPAIGRREIAAAVEVLRSGWLTTGTRAHELEALVRERIGVRHALAVNSGTSALHLALLTLGVGKGDEVVIPTATFTACGEVCAYLGAIPVLADVGEDGLLGPETVDPHLSTRTKAVMPVHLGGLAVDISAIRSMISDGVAIVEDAAHALPAHVRGVPTGRLGDAAAFSFYATKTVTTAGEGGMLVTDNDDVAARATRLRLHGIDADAWNRYGEGGSWFYQVYEPGFKYNLSDVAAAVGVVQFGRLDELANARAGIAEQYDSALDGCDLLTRPPRRAEDGHAWHLYVPRLALDSLTVDRAEVIRRLAEAGIGTSVHFIPLHLHPWYQRDFGYRPGQFPVAEALFECSISLPIWPGMTKAQVTRVASTLLAILEDARRPTEI
jgi:dTDP-4-amino-4,6-dideoxygalactose transaminase